MIAPQATDRRRFTTYDEADLRWFFGAGQSAFEGSPWGRMLEAAEALSMTSAGERVLSPPEHRVQVWEYRQRNCCRDSTIGFDASLRDILRRAAAPFVEEFDPSLDADGQDDSGGAWGDGPHDHVLCRYGRVSRRLRASQGRLYSALAAYHGLAANRYETGSLGRWAAIMPLTAAGEKLLEARSRRLGEHDEAGQPAERLVAEWQVLQQQKRPEDLKRRLFEQARGQCRQLLHEAQDSYAGSDDDDPVGPLGVHLTWWTVAK